MSDHGLATPMTEADQMQAADGTTITIGDDGEVYFDSPVKAPAIRRNKSEIDFNENLAETVPESVLADMVNDYLDGVNADILSRQDFIQNRNKGVDLLGLKIEEASAIRGNRTSISRAKNPSLLKACMGSQSMSRGQILPATGPAKIQTISGESDGEDNLAQHFGQDFNYFLTHVDRGYYADTDRMLFYRAFEGSAYKKVYRDGILRRPTSRFCSLDSLIVSEDATCLADALRKTQELVYNPVQVRRMQASGAWLDVDLGIPMQNVSQGRRKVLESQGLSAATTRSQDISFTLYEGYSAHCAVDYGWDDPLADPYMPCPYRLTFDRDSRQVLALHRNWKKDDEAFRERDVFVKYGLVPGLGFLDYGFLHLIGNQTRVLSAIWQIMVDKGMIGNFPGGLKVKGVRAATNELNPGLGEWAEVDIGSMKSIKDALMGLPYGDVTPGLIQLAEMLQKDVDSVSGGIEFPTGQGQVNTPVGTILAMIEQQAQNLTAVQQRDHRAQEEELRLIRDLFIEYPEDLRHLKRPGSDRKWQDMVAEFADMDLVPASDPNIPSQAHRILINQFLVSIAEKAPYLFGPQGLRKSAVRVLRGVGINDAEDLIQPVQAIAQAMSQQGQGKGSGAGQASLAKTQMELPLKQAELQLEQQKLGLEAQENQRQAANEAQEGNLRAAKQSTELAHAEAELQQEERRLQMEEAQGAGADPQAVADLEKTKAQTFSAMGAGAMGFAKANETVAQGERDTQDFEDGTENGREVPEPAQGTGLQGAPKPRKKAAAKPKKDKPKK